MRNGHQTFGMRTRPSIATATACALLPGLLAAVACTGTLGEAGTGSDGDLGRSQAAGGAMSTGAGGSQTHGSAGGSAASNAGGAQGQGGGTTTSTTSSTTTGTTGQGGAQGQGGVGGAPSTDPCAGASDGAHCGSDLGNGADGGALYQCSGGKTSSADGCPAGCTNGACKQVPQDPCASAKSGDGAYCGSSLTGGDAGALYHCKGQQTASKDACPAGCQIEPPGVSDVCKSQGDPCAGASSGNGAYCAGSLGNGDPNVLYHCQNKQTASQETCNGGCQMNPPGQDDACKQGGNGGCCLQRPAGSVTQTYSACGGGGKHYGIDYGTGVGTPIYAGMAGTVVGSALGFPNCWDNGCTKACWNAFNYVKLKADCGDPQDGAHDLFVYYLHIDSLAAGIANGTHVDQGQLVATSGNSGCSSGPHIHLETASVPKGQSAVLNTCASVDPSSRFCP